MNIRPLIAIAIIANIFLPQSYGQANTVVTPSQLLATDVISQDAPTVDKVEAADEVFRLFKNHPTGLKINGWLAIGNGGLADHNSTDGRLSPDVVGVNQLGISMDKAGDKFRLHLDVLYGRDAGHFRSFSNANDGWDNSADFRHGDHAMALPQAFVETTAGDWTIKAGHFLANNPSGQYSTDRFFSTRTQGEQAYSPVTLSGLLGSRKIGETDVTIGWAQGTNTGFDNLDTFERNGTFVLGLERGLGDKLSFTYNALFGDMSGLNIPDNVGDLVEGFYHFEHLGGGFPSESILDEAYYHDLTLNYEASERLRVALTHVFITDDTFDGPIVILRQTTYYILSDHITLGQRYENVSLANEFFSESLSVGVNYQSTRWSNVLLRPEIRWEKDGHGVSQTDFFMDVVIRF